MLFRSPILFRDGRVIEDLIRPHFRRYQAVVIEVTQRVGDNELLLNGQLIETRVDARRSHASASPVDQTVVVVSRNALHEPGLDLFVRGRLEVQINRPGIALVTKRLCDTRLLVGGEA